MVQIRSDNRGQCNARRDAYAFTEVVAVDETPVCCSVIHLLRLTPNAQRLTRNAFCILLYCQFQFRFFKLSRNGLCLIIMIVVDGVER